MIEKILYVAHDHLNADRGVLKLADPKTSAVVLVESQRMTKGRNWHPERLFFLLSSARHFARELESQGFTVSYIQAPTTVDGLLEAKRVFGELPIFSAEPSSHRQYEQLADFGVNFQENDFFITPRKLFEQWANSQKTYVMENFYRAQRLRLGILVEQGKPVGGRWNFDADNRLGPPKNYEWPSYLEHQRDELDLGVAEQLSHTPTHTWATTRAGALTQLEHFIKHNLAGFGPYEDAVTEKSWALHHSLLSPYLNNGLLTAQEVVDAVLAAFANGQAPIESVEAFVRQVIGWREYINGMYWHLGAEYRDKNALQAKRKLLPLYSDSSKTEMRCVKSAVADVETRAWTHHIPRLMVLSNLALVTSVEPRVFLDWMREQFIDASDWVMVPNVIGMAVHADGGMLMTKPYAAGGAYLNRMTDHCKSCRFDPKLRVGSDACPFTTLYWDFLDSNREHFAKNHRMFQQYAGLGKLKDLAEVRIRAAEVKQLLEEGKL